MVGYALRPHQRPYNIPSTDEFCVWSVSVKVCTCFFDDILIYSPTWNAHIEHLFQVLATMKKHSLFAKLSKCSFGQQKVDYLGHVVSKDGVRVDESKIKAIKQWPVPSSTKQLRAFLGLASYYLKFIKNFATLAAPLIDLLKKDAFHWNDLAHQAFAVLKETLTQASILAIPDFSKPFVLETDALGTGIGAVLSQDNHPIAFFSEKISLLM